MIAYNKHVIVTRDADKSEEITTGGIHIQLEQKKREEMQVICRWGTIVSVGAEVETLKTGWRIAYNPYDGAEHYDMQTGITYDFVPANGIRAYEKVVK